jgi:hypothetical protein
MLSSLLLLTSCDDDDEDCFTTETVDAMLVWSGDYALDGCGYLLQVGENTYKPSNEMDISDHYKASSPAPVEAKIINYHKTVKACMTGTEFNSIEVVTLRPK